MRIQRSGGGDDTTGSFERLLRDIWCRTRPSLPTRTNSSEAAPLLTFLDDPVDRDIFRTGGLMVLNEITTNRKADCPGELNIILLAS